MLIDLAIILASAAGGIGATVAAARMSQRMRGIILGTQRAGGHGDAE